MDTQVIMERSMAEKILTIDTKESLKPHDVKIDGTIYTINPIGAGSFLKLSSKKDVLDALQNLNEESLHQLEDEIYPIVRDLIQPADKFAEWENKIRAKNELVWVQVMNQLLRIVCTSVHIKVG